MSHASRNVFVFHAECIQTSLYEVMIIATRINMITPKHYSLKVKILSLIFKFEFFCNILFYSILTS